MLGAVAGGVHDADPHPADLDDLRVGERFEGVLGLGDRMDRHRQSVFEREAPVPREMVSVGVGLEHPVDPNTVCLGRLQVLLDVKGGVDDDGDSRFGVTDQVRGAPEVVVHELPKEQHGSRG